MFGPGAWELLILVALVGVGAIPVLLILAVLVLVSGKIRKKQFDTGKPKRPA